MGLGAYFIQLLSKTIKRENFTVINSVQKFNLAESKTPLHLTKDIFDIGINLEYVGSDKRIKDEGLDEYFNFNLYTVNYEIINDPKMKEIVGNTYFWNTTA